MFCLHFQTKLNKKMKRVSLPRDWCTRFQMYFSFPLYLQDSVKWKLITVHKEIHWRNGNQETFWQSWWFSIFIIVCATKKFSVITPIRLCNFLMPLPHPLISSWLAVNFLLSPLYTLLAMTDSPPFPPWVPCDPFKILRPRPTSFKR